MSDKTNNLEINDVSESGNNCLQAEKSCVDSDGIIRITQAELSQYLKCFHMLFTTVRILDENCCRYCVSYQDGTFSEKREPCYEIWKRSTRCINCVSLRSLKMKRTEHKFEVADDEVYIVFSLYMEVDGVPKVAELINPVGDDILHGFQQAPTFREVLMGENMELYMDLQLGIYNRRFFEECKEKLNNITALAMIDIDAFKNVNDRYGHLMGDCVLKAVAAVLKENIRENDYLIRVGGDEMMIGFTGMKALNLSGKLEELREAVEKMVVPENKDIHVTICAGGTVCSGYSDEARKRADEALYVGKIRKNAAVVKM